MGKNKSKNNRSGNNSEKWEQRIDKTLNYAGKAASVAAAVFTAIAAGKQLKK